MKAECTQYINMPTNKRKRMLTLACPRSSSAVSWTRPAASIIPESSPPMTKKESRSRQSIHQTIPKEAAISCSAQTIPLTVEAIYTKRIIFPQTGTRSHFDLLYFCVVSFSSRGRETKEERGWIPWVVSILQDEVFCIWDFEESFSWVLNMSRSSLTYSVSSGPGTSYPPVRQVRHLCSHLSDSLSTVDTSCRLARQLVVLNMLPIHYTLSKQMNSAWCDAYFRFLRNCQSHRETEPSRGAKEPSAQNN